MRRFSLGLLVPLALGGCLSYSETPARRETVVVPPKQTVVVPPGTTTVIPSGSTVVCSNGLAPPC
jgi:hypothetical protein